MKYLITLNYDKYDSSIKKIADILQCIKIQTSESLAESKETKKTYFYEIEIKLKDIK